MTNQHQSKLRAAHVLLLVLGASACAFQQADKGGPEVALDDTPSTNAALRLAPPPRSCKPRQCGPQLGLPNYLCSDGITVAGPTGNCLRQPDGSCSWEVISCPPADKPCASSTQCADGEYCTTEDGVCNRPPGCGPNDVCPALCYGVCAKKPIDPCAGKSCGDPCVGPFASPLPTYCDAQGQCRPMAEPPSCKFYNCDQSTVRCEAPVQQCPPGQTPSVVGVCYGPCVPIGQCKCSTTVPTSCPPGYA